MGDHTDYNDGFVLPMAIDVECRVSVRPARDGRIRLRSACHPPADVAADGSDDPLAVEPGWARYVAALARVLAERGRRAAGVDGAVESTVPEGAGLSSSAALEVACALALAAAGGVDLEPRELALACQEAEQLATGVPSGIMDQLVSICGRAASALLIDCRDLALDEVPWPAELQAVVVHSGQPRTLAATEYTHRRRECAAAAAAIGVDSLRDATPEQAQPFPRARHVVSENARVRRTAEALRDADTDALARLFAASHASLRDDFEVSTPALDALVEALTHAGALGARLTGAGFGGCVVALAPADEASGVARAATRRYAEQTGLEPRTWLPKASAGAGPW